MDLHARLKDGKLHTCPVCDQKCKIYKRRFNSGMAGTLCWMVSTFDGDWLDIPKCGPRFVLAAREYNKTRHWGLAEQKTNGDNPAKKNSGLWRPTAKGVDFIERRITIPSHVFLHNNHVLDFSNEQTDIIEALGENFDYDELMQAAPVPTPQQP